MFTDALRQAGIASLISMFVGLVPLGFGIRYAIQPTEQRLSLMRPLSLAAVFAAVHGSTMGVVNVFRNVALQDSPAFDRIAYIGLAESGVPIMFDFGCLMLAWLCVAIGLWRRP